MVASALNFLKFLFVIVIFAFAGHPWVQIDGVAPDKPLDSAIFTRLTQFSAMNKLKKMAIRVRHPSTQIVSMIWTTRPWTSTKQNR